MLSMALKVLNVILVNIKKAITKNNKNCGQK